MRLQVPLKLAGPAVSSLELQLALLQLRLQLRDPPLVDVQLAEQQKKAGQQRRRKSIPYKEAVLSLQPAQSVCQPEARTPWALPQEENPQSPRPSPAVLLTK